MNFEKQFLSKSGDVPTKTKTDAENPTQKSTEGYIAMNESEQVSDVSKKEGNEEVVADTPKALEQNDKPAAETDPNLGEANLPNDYYRYMNESRSHDNKAREYERKANSLESDLSRGRVAKDKISSTKSEIASLRRKAEQEKRESERCKHAAKRALTAHSGDSAAFDGQIEALEEKDFAVDNEMNGDQTTENASIEVCRKSRTPQLWW